MDTDLIREDTQLAIGYRDDIIRWWIGHFGDTGGIGGAMDVTMSGAASIEIPYGAGIKACPCWDKQ